MTYLEVVDLVRDDLDAGAEGDAVQVGLHLAVVAWRSLAGDDPAWDTLGLEVLSVMDQLYPRPTVLVEADPPEHDGPKVRAAVSGLVDAVAGQIGKAAANDGRPLSKRLTDDAVATRLRRAAAVLR